MRLTWRVALFALLSLGASCSSDEEAQPASTTVASVTGSTPVTTTSDAATSTAATTTAAPTTTAVPTTTIDPTDALIAEIEADLNEGEQVTAPRSV
jgi:predicted secreted protein